METQINGLTFLSTVDVLCSESDRPFRSDSDRPALVRAVPCRSVRILGGVQPGETGPQQRRAGI